MKKIKHLEIIVKVSERCNINCTYCYVFNMGNDLAINSKPVISLKTVSNLKRFLERSLTEYNIESIQVDLHGGEPLMLNRERFSRMCEELMSGDYKGAKFSIACQTNATLIDDEWIDIFSKYNISVSVSIDGPKHINDKNRIDNKGKGTYDATVSGLFKLQSAWMDGKLPSAPGVLCVANPNSNGAEVYRHFVDVLNCKSFDFLIPDESHDNCKNPYGISDFFCSAVDEFFSDADKKIIVRYFYATIQGMLNPGIFHVAGMGKMNNDIVAFTMGSEGNIHVDDILRSSNDDIFTAIGNVNELSLSNVISSWQMQKYFEIGNNLPEKCNECVWKNICGGGNHIQRYSKKDGFNRRTVFCPSVKKILSRIASHLISPGINEDFIAKNLGC
ncbi:cyclophane-forming radical SAM/SPASM peptide maturase XyeB [Photorhabdus laumondii]